MSASMDIRIRADVDPQNINICRFTIDRPVHNGSVTFTNQQEAAGSVAENIFRIPGIEKVEVNDNVVAVTQSGGQDWRQIGKRIGSAIRTFINPPPPIAEGQLLTAEQLRARVQQVFDEQINPGVASHGGFVELLDVQDDNIYIRMGGGCQGCGAADVTLRMGIERLIRESVPQVREIFDTTDHASGQNPYYAASK
ncbi:MAG TPA: NifU family protein [Blastocatellia bacterium]|jgi:Fe-S cluster biogenesis protein NfuA